MCLPGCRSSVPPSRVYCIRQRELILHGMNKFILNRYITVEHRLFNAHWNDGVEHTPRTHPQSIFPVGIG